MPLPPAFNARPFTMLSYLKVFGLPVYHGKELWKRQDLNGRPKTCVRPATHALALSAGYHLGTPQRTP